MSNIHIKKAQPKDVSQVAPLFDDYRQFYEQAPNLQLATDFLIQRLKNNESVILIAENDAQKIVGFCQLYPSFCSVIAAPVYVLYDLFVAAAERKSGIGKALMEAATEHAREQGFSRLDLTTAKDNITAQSVYETLGWVKDEVFYTYNKTVTP